MKSLGIRLTCRRYTNWVDGLNGDWLISRQRFFGVPIPLWYKLDEQGEPIYEQPIIPDVSALPVDLPLLLRQDLMNLREVNLMVSQVIQMLWIRGRLS